MSNRASLVEVKNDGNIKSGRGNDDNRYGINVEAAKLSREGQVEKPQFFNPGSPSLPRKYRTATSLIFASKFGDSLTNGFEMSEFKPVETFPTIGKDRDTVKYSNRVNDYIVKHDKEATEYLKSKNIKPLDKKEQQQYLEKIFKGSGYL